MGRCKLKRNPMAAWHGKFKDRIPLSEGLGGYQPCLALWCKSVMMRETMIKMNKLESEKKVAIGESHTTHVVMEIVN